jgi:hypothetical protein
MAESRLSEAAVEALLRDVGAELDFPPTPDLARAAAARLSAPPRRPLWQRLFGDESTPRFAFAALALALALSLLLATSPVARTAVADALGLRGLIIHRLPQPPAASTDLRLGERVPPPEAQRRAPFPLLQPTVLGPPIEAYVDAAVGQFAFVYRPRILLTQFQAGLEPGFFAKGLGPDTRVEQLEVNGGRAFWIAGRAHVFYYRDKDGQIRDESIRLAGDVLLWEQAGLTLRLEGAPSRDEALRIARSVT